MQIMLPFNLDSGGSLKTKGLQCLAVLRCTIGVKSGCKVIGSLGSKCFPSPQPCAYSSIEESTYVSMVLSIV